MSDKFNGLRIEFHILQSFPVSCLNRDDLGSPKSALIGGVPRARVSSQCWKRAVRMQMHELGVATAYRTRNVSEFIRDKCLELGATDVQALLCGNDFVKFLNKGNDKDKEDKGDKKKGKKVENEQLSAENTPTEASALFFLSEKEAAVIAAKYKENGFAKLSSKELKKIYGEPLYSVHDGLDIALFGRMVANAADMNIEAAASFAHAVSTHRVDPEIDFFTAVDDLRKEDQSGSAHMGSLEFNSATYYRYVGLDLGELARTLHTDEIFPAVESFTKALFLAVPAARQATMAAATPWDYAIVTLRRGQGMQLSFNTAVRTTAKEPDIVVNSIGALKERFSAAERMYGSLFGLKKKLEIGLGQGSVDELIEGLRSAVAAL